MEKFLLTRNSVKHGGHSILARGLYALQLEPWIDALATDQILIISIGKIKFLFFIHLLCFISFISFRILFVSCHFYFPSFICLSYSFYSFFYTLSLLTI